MMASPRSSALFAPELKQALKEKDFHGLKDDLAELGVLDLAEGWGDFTPFEQIVLFKLLPSARALELFEELEPAEQIHILQALDLGALGPVLEDMPGPEAERL